MSKTNDQLNNTIDAIEYAYALEHSSDQKDEDFGPNRELEDKNEKYAPNKDQNNNISKTRGGKVLPIGGDKVKLYWPEDDQYYLGSVLDIYNAG